VVALAVLCVLELALLVGALGDTPNPSVRSVTVAPAEDGCVLVLHGVRHEIRPASECVSVGRALIQMAGK
jgi:hypothetical protein